MSEDGGSVQRCDCECGAAPEVPASGRRFRCEVCGRIYVPRDLDYHDPSPGIATAESWKHEPYDGSVERFEVDWSYPAEDLERIRWGLIPRSMDEKWFAYVDGNELALHRSWTGRFCFRVHLTETGVASVEAADDLEDPAAELPLVRWIVEALLIGLDVEFPRRR